MPVSIRQLDLTRDLAAMHAIHCDDETCTYLIDPPTNSPDETRALIERYDSDHWDFSWVICDEPDGEALGRVKMIPRGQDTFEVAIMLCPGNEGRGLAFAGTRLAMEHVFNHHGARRIFADIDPDNMPSLKLFEALGFTREGYLRQTWHTHIGVRDTVMMGLVASDPKPRIQDTRS
ncbi:MAG: GNAT family N-acetyltransferase [Pseudomonadota bacterium]